MPARVHSRPEMVRTPSEKHHEHDSFQANKNMQHKEALRLALGSILAPKRSYTPSSRSSSGTASPAHPASFTPPPPPYSASNQGAESGRTDALLHPRNPYFLHTPSRLAQSESTDHSPSGSAASSPVPSQPAETQGSQPSTPLSLPEPAVSDHPQTSDGQVYAVRAPKPVSVPQPDAPSAVPTPESKGYSGSGSGSGTPKAKFIETLQSKSAWDALIHGSFS